eukprot:SAG25_NODE_2078_length_1979_cov_6.534327_2_plen_78_part_00
MWSSEIQRRPGRHLLALAHITQHHADISTQSGLYAGDEMQRRIDGGDNHCGCSPPCTSTVASLLATGAEIQLPRGAA